MNELSHEITPKENGLIKSIATRILKQYCLKNKMITHEDLVHWGIIGLLEAKQRYDPLRKVPWINFAAIRVRGAMLDALREQSFIKVPQKVREKIRELKKAKNELEETQSKAIDISEHESVSHKVLALNPCVFSIDTYKPDNTGDDIKDKMCQELVFNGRDPEQEAIGKNLLEIIDMCLKKLSIQSQIILISRIIYEVKLKELAHSYNCSMENIRLQQKKASLEMRRCLKANNVESAY